MPHQRAGEDLQVDERDEAERRADRRVAFLDRRFRFERIGFVDDFERGLGAHPERPRRRLDDIGRLLLHRPAIRRVRIPGWAGRVIP